MSILGAIKVGDEFAYEQAYEMFRAKVYGYFLKRTHSHEDALDLVQTTFLNLWKYRKSLSEQYSADQQIYHIARNVYIDYLRKAKRRNKIFSTQEANPDLSSKEVLQPSDFDLKRRLNDALSTMPELRQQVFKYSRIYGCSYEEIAEKLCISVKSVDNNLAKALKQLRQMMISLAAAVSLLALYY